MPASANYHTLTEILRDEWGFRGFVVSDWDSIWRDQYGTGVAPPIRPPGRAQKAFHAGVDMDMQSGLYSPKLPELIKSGKVKVEDVDRSVARVLRIKFALGLFDRPYTDVKQEMEALVVVKTKYEKLARRAAEESFVLLKNEPVEGKPLLPLAADKKVALIGALADDRPGMLGAWVMKANPQLVVTVAGGGLKSDVEGSG